MQWCITYHHIVACFNNLLYIVVNTYASQRKKLFFMSLTSSTEQCFDSTLHRTIYRCIRGNKSYRYVYTLYCCNSSSYSATSNALKVKAYHYSLTYFCELLQIWMTVLLESEDNCTHISSSYITFFALTCWMDLWLRI